MSDDRPNERGERVPLRVPIELGHGDFEDSFEADGVNLSRGGVSLRAACLPDPGSRLSLRFRCEPSGKQISAQGEVVWAHLDGEHRGEFGLAFVDLDAPSEWLIEEMIAEHAARNAVPGQAPAPADAGPKVAQLELEGSPEPIEARVVRADGDHVVFEQRLDLLKLGRGVRAYGEASARAHAGAIAAVELRMVGSVPMLAVTVAFDDEAGPALGAPEHDTEPDMAAPLAAIPNPTLMEFDREGRVPAVQLKGKREALEEAVELDVDSQRDPDPDSDAALDANADADPDSEWQSVTQAGIELTDVHERPTFRPGAPAACVVRPPVPARRASVPTPVERKSQPAPPQLEPTVVVATEPASRPAPTPPPATPREWSTSFELHDRSGDPPPSAEPEQLDLPPFEPEPPALQLALVQLGRVLRRHGLALSAALAGLLAAAYRSASPEIRARVRSAGGALSGAYEGRIGPQLGAVRRLVLGRLHARPRRKTSSPQSSAQPASRAGLGRTVLIGLLAAGAIGFGVYALAPAADEGPELHRKIDESALGEAPISPVASTAPVDLIGAPPLVAPDPKLVPSAHAVPPSSPFAVDVRDKPAPARKPAAAAAPAAPASAVGTSAPAAAPVSAAGTAVAAPAPRKLRLGAAQAPRGRRFALRMSGRIQSLSGSEDAGGFSVNIAGALALDRAGPIASAHGAVERSMIINRGDHAELTIRFDAGKRPTYQVVAEGATLYVTIQDL